MIRELTYDEIRFSYQGHTFEGEDTSTTIIGQERGVAALRLGLQSSRSGYNIFISGDIGTGRLSAVRQECEKLRGERNLIKDVVYASNPVVPTEPVCLLFTPGVGRLFVKALSDLSEENYKAELERMAKQEEFSSAERYLALLSRYPFSDTMRSSSLVLDRTGEEKRPLIIDTHPTFANLFGYYDKEAPSVPEGIHLGSYGKAAGGFLVLTAEELLAEAGLWDELKRHLDSTAMALTGRDVQGSIGKREHVRPQPVPLQTKVILLGSDDIYDELCEKDGQFLRLFKSAPQFDYQMVADGRNISGTAAYLRGIAKRHGKRMSDTAIEEILRYSSWFCESREMLTTQLSLLGDLAEEAILLSQEEVSGEAVREAEAQRSYISGISEEKINREIRDGDLIVDVKGVKVGVINGLAVMDRGLASFGTPAVISATVAPGSEGIVNIEHEAGLSGEIHDKGILILEGYLRKQYARTFPLSIYAGICFEQNYSEVDGDSASSSELYALLSAIGEVPVRQDIAVTGSVNQMGALQPVGGINEKITGFWKTCRTCGLTGTQGVIIPRQNIRSLILPPEIEEDIKAGVFHIWALSDIEEGMELLTGMKAGTRDRKGQFTRGSFNAAIEERLKALYEAGKSN